MDSVPISCTAFLSIPFSSILSDIGSFFQSDSLAKNKKGLLHESERLRATAPISMYFSIPSELVAQDDIMRAALDDAGRGNERKFRLLAELRETECATVAHGRANLGERRFDIFLQGACVRNIGVNALLEGELFAAAKVITLPVARTIRALAPILLVVCAVHHDAIRRTLVKA